MNKHFNIVKLVAVIGLLLIAIFGFVLIFHTTASDQESDGSITEETIISKADDTVVTKPDMVKDEPTFINSEGMDIESRVRVPEGYERTEAGNGSFAEFVRKYPLKDDGSPILLYNGKKRNPDYCIAVLAMHLGDKDLQQCADSVIRLYAEYFRQTGLNDRIAFHFVNGFLCDWNSYREGKRIKVTGNDVSWVSSANADNSDEAFEGYLETVFNYASTISMMAESDEIDVSEIEIGDIFIYAGSPGHVEMVCDVCEKSGKKAFLLAQGLMPAQEMHVLNNPRHPEDPWYYEDEVDYPFETAFSTFEEGSLRRLNY